MADKTGIEWTDATCIVDRDGRRVRVYRKKQAGRPGQQERRTMAAMGLRWCRECRWWLPSEDVTKSGLCTPHEREDYRQRYAANPEPIRQRVYARKRGVLPVPPDAGLVAEVFDRLCAYCESEADGWDHIVPVSAGGDSIPGNVVPACISCNSSKKDRDVWDWLLSTGRSPHPYFPEYVSLLEVV